MWAGAARPGPALRASGQARRWHRREAMAFEGLEVPGRPLPLLLVNAAERPQEGQGFVLVVEPGERGHDDAAALDKAGGGTSYDGGEAAGAVGYEGDL